MYKRQLQILDALDLLEKAPVDEEHPYEIIADYIQKKGLTYKGLLLSLIHISDGTVKEVMAPKYNCYAKGLKVRPVSYTHLGSAGEDSGRSCARTAVRAYMPKSSHDHAGGHARGLWYMCDMHHFLFGSRRADRFLGCGFFRYFVFQRLNLSLIHIYEAVFPVPVCAQPKMSFFANATGIAFS